MRIDFHDLCLAIKNRGAAIWEHRSLGYIIWFSPVGFLIAFFFSTPPPGWAIAVCGVFMGLVITRGELTSAQKLFSLIIIFALLFFELHSIEVDKSSQEKEHQDFVDQALQPIHKRR